MVGELGRVQVRVEAGGREQLRVTAPFQDATLGENEDVMGVADRRQPLGDDDQGPPLRGHARRRLHRGLGLGVVVRGRLVEHDDAGCCEQQPRDGDTLLFAVRQAVAAVADESVEPVGERLDEVEDLRPCERGTGLVLARVGLGAGQIGADRVVEEVGVLSDDANDGVRSSTGTASREASDTSSAQG